MPIAIEDGGPGVPERHPILTRIVLALTALPFVAALSFFGLVVLIYLGGPEAGLGSCAPMGVFAAVVALAVTGVPFAFVWSRLGRRRRGVGARGPAAPCALALPPGGTAP